MYIYIFISFIVSFNNKKERVREIDREKVFSYHFQRNTFAFESQFEAKDVRRSINRMQLVTLFNIIREYNFDANNKGGGGEGG